MKIETKAWLDHLKTNPKKMKYQLVDLKDDFCRCVMGWGLFVLGETSGDAWSIQGSHVLKLGIRTREGHTRGKVGIKDLKGKVLKYSNAKGQEFLINSIQKLNDKTDLDLRTIASIMEKEKDLLFVED